MLVEIKKYIIGIIAGILAIMGIYLKGKSKGKEEQKAEENEKILDNVKKVSVARNDDDKRARVRKKYTKR